MTAALGKEMMAEFDMTEVAREMNRIDENDYEDNDPDMMKGADSSDDKDDVDDRDHNKESTVEEETEYSDPEEAKEAMK